MRDIIFRGKEKKTGKWYEGDLVRLKDGEKVSWHIYGKAEVIPETVGQFTGLTDKNGKRIFEGDIIMDTGKYIRYVKYSGECAQFVEMRYIDRLESEYVGRLGKGYANYRRSVEVIGNIHDNPEMLR